MRKLTLLLTFLFALPLFADEGMWMPQQIPAIGSELVKQGLKLDPAALADLTGDPMGAVISLGGCTASFVSPEGLIVTNHHCVFGSVQANSTAQRDLIENGFLAKTREEELPAAPGTRAWVTTGIEDVTTRMNAAVDASMSDIDRAKALEQREKQLTAECEKPGGVRCRVASFFEGAQYLRLTQAEISDVRLVYAPARAIGEYGGEVDNFEWPRHTGDWGFYRAYVDGKPYHPQHWLKLSAEGADEGDFVLVAGYPGRTFRYKTTDEVRNYQEFVYPTTIRYMKDLISILEEGGKGNKEAAILNAARVKGFLNSLKNYTSVNEGFAKDHIVEARQAREGRLRQAIATNGALARYAGTLDAIAKLNAAQLRTRERDAVLEWMTGRGSQLMGQARTITRLAGERQKDDAARLPGYQERDFDRLMQGSQRTQRSLDVATERATLRYFVVAAERLPADQRIKPVDDAVETAGSIDALIDRLFAGTKIASGDERAKMYRETPAQLKARDDSMLNLAAALLPLIEANDARDLAYSGAMSRLRPGYFEALQAVDGKTLYPDANSTLRITFGTVRGYSPRDATWYTPKTTLAGVLQKETGEEPFASPAALLAAAANPARTKPYRDAHSGDVPVNFLSTCDTTGGNSGSPTLNAKGELVGLLFDGNYESIDSDFLFNPAVNRSIHVDTQYMLWVMDAVDGADNLLRELGVTPKVD